MLNCYMNDTITVVRLPSTPTDKWGENKTATEYLRMGRVEWRTSLIRDQQGEEVVSSGYVLMDYDADITVEDKIKIDSVSYTVLRVEELKDFSKRGLRVYLQ